MTWVKPEFSHGRVNAAGDLLANRRFPPALPFDQALDIVGNWRSSHAYPLRVICKNLRDNASLIDPEAIVVQRLKRLPSITRKLQRYDNMQLSRMQDLGGCRAIMNTYDDLRALVSKYDAASFSSAKLISKYDYVATPKPDGYRGVHYVFEYQSTSAKRSIYSGKRIEVQIRSRIQHVWATAVETIDTLTGQGLKSGVGRSDWQRFFALMSIYFACQECQDLQELQAIADPPVDIVDFLNQANLLAESLDVSALLKRLVIAAETVREVTNEKSEYFQQLPKGFKPQSAILMLNGETSASDVEFFSENLHATDRYLQLEKEYMNSASIQLVLVSVHSIAILRKAYPNYFQDAAEFAFYVSHLQELARDTAIKVNSAKSSKLPR